LPQWIKIVKKKDVEEGDLFPKTYHFVFKRGALRENRKKVPGRRRVLHVGLKQSQSDLLRVYCGRSTGYGQNRILDVVGFFMDRLTFDY
jgi:hypothetical protein